ncbi:hypothetical protein EXIGLDRAFT_700254 [Exidia glandulosa HHB12029]|uniref:Uncharacterized protein n=1 Tax=Exidia glandulosa HHB12029 TaxID=1314781 RepID=A0A165DIG6_EXIGL|nr:hypothetical protein EXIGLDRAFT_700254 [Exidia glandulosa HHB12029]
MAARTLLQSTNVRSSIQVARAVRQGDDSKLCTTPNTDLTRTDVNGIGAGIAGPSSRTLKTPVDVLLGGLSRDLRGEPEQNSRAESTAGRNILHAERRQRKSTQTAPENFAIKHSAYWQKRGCT